MKRFLFLNPPSYEGFDGGAGSRYQARREVRSFWYPTWLAQAAALCPGSRLLDAPAQDMTPEAVLAMAGDFDGVVLFTSTPGFPNDARLVEAHKKRFPASLVGMVGPHPTVLSEDCLRRCPSLDYVVRGEFDLTVRDMAEGRPFPDIPGITFRDKGGGLTHTPARPPMEDMDALPSVLDVYRRDLRIDAYFIGYLLHPYLSLYTGRGCPNRCTFCLWPQTIAGQRYRVRSPASVVAEMARAREMFPEVKEFFFDDDTFTADLGRAETIARGLKPLRLVWSCSSRANVPEKTLAVLKDSGLRCLMVGVESGSDEILGKIRKGVTTDRIRTFMGACRRLGITVHATFVVGLPGETRETLQKTIDFAKEIDPFTLQVSIATPYPGTELYAQALAEGWITEGALVSEKGVQQAALQLPGLSRREIEDAVERLYTSFFLRPRPILRILRTMLRDRDVCRRRLREAREFFGFLRERKEA